MSATIVEKIEISKQHQAEVASGERFEFGKNWSAFLSVLDDERIATAEASLKEMLECLRCPLALHMGQQRQRASLIGHIGRREIMVG